MSKEDTEKSMIRLASERKRKSLLAFGDLIIAMTPAVKNSVCLLVLLTKNPVVLVRNGKRD